MRQAYSNWQDQPGNYRVVRPRHGGRHKADPPVPDPDVFSDARFIGSTADRQPTNFPLRQKARLRSEIERVARAESEAHRGTKPRLAGNKTLVKTSLDARSPDSPSECSTLLLQQEERECKWQVNGRRRGLAPALSPPLPRAPFPLLALQGNTHLRFSPLTDLTH